MGSREIAADAVLDAPNPMTAEQKARRQVLAGLLNFVAFNVSDGSLMVDTTGSTARRIA